MDNLRRLTYFAAIVSACAAAPASSCSATVNNEDVQLRQRPRAPSESLEPERLRPPDLPPPTRASRKLLPLLITAILITGGVYWIIRQRKGAAAAAASNTPGSLAVPVAAATVARQDTPIYLDGIGSVQAYNTVTVRARVDGQLQKIYFTEGKEVRQGDPLAEIDPAPFQTEVEQQQAKKLEDQAQLANAQLQLKRDADLLAQKILAQQDYDSQQALAAQLNATVQADQAAIDSARVQLGYTTIRSPIDGRAGLRLVDAGNIVHAADPNGIVVLTQLKPISILFTLPEQDLPEIQAQMANGPLAVLAMDRDNLTRLGEGKLAVIDNQIDTATGAIRLKANFDNADLRLWPGQFVNARLLLRVRAQGIVVPAAVIQRGPDGPYAFMIQKDLTVKVRPVKVAQIQDGLALIDSGLAPGERVVEEGQYRLQNGSPVKIRPAASASRSENVP